MLFKHWDYKDFEFSVSFHWAKWRMLIWENSVSLNFNATLPKWIQIFLVLVALAHQLNRN